ncbi:hypothetical protein MXB_3248 [Myxobolus squamalis]|nr:hypothetical protein MXB_3248 [Myxobolus squamalis]
MIIKIYSNSLLILILVLSMFVNNVACIELDPSLLKAILKNINLEDRDIKRLMPLIDDIKKPNDEEKNENSRQKGFSITNSKNMEYENLEKINQLNKINELNKIYDHQNDYKNTPDSNYHDSTAINSDKNPTKPQINFEDDTISVDASAISPEIISKIIELSRKDKNSAYSSESPENVLTSSKSRDENPDNYNSIYHPYQQSTEKPPKISSYPLNEKIANYDEPKYELSRDSEGKLILVDMRNYAKETKNTDLHNPGVERKKYSEENPSTRQSLQISTLAQALYTPYSSDKNMIHLNLKGKDGKKGNLGERGPPGPPGPEGMIGPKGEKGIHGTCGNSVSGMYTCTDEEIAKISFQVDYLERICHKILPPAPIIPSGILGSETNPMSSCQALFDNDPDAKSGAYWLMIDGIKFKTKCYFELGRQRGWTLVAKILGKGYEFSPVSNIWADKSVINADSIVDDESRNTSKSHAWFLLRSNSLKLCIDGLFYHCADFTHNLGITLSDLFESQYGVSTEENWEFKKLLNAFGKTCNTKNMKKEWCGLNLANICHPQEMNPNLNPTNHIVRIGCIGSEDIKCTPSDFAIGVGVSSCYDGYGCERLGPSTPNLHWSCKPFYGTFDKISFLYVN